MDAHQIAFERGVGDAFTCWLNARDGRQLIFEGRPEEAPDLLYCDGPAKVALEIAGVYYDEKEASVWWGAKRGNSSAPCTWSGNDMETTCLFQALTNGLRRNV
jgi:hypothetical protein